MDIAVARTSPDATPPPATPPKRSSIAVRGTRLVAFLVQAWAKVLAFFSPATVNGVRRRCRLWAVGVRERCDALKVLLLALCLFLGVLFLTDVKSFVKGAGWMGMAISVFILLLASFLGSFSISLALTSQWFAQQVVAGAILQRTPFTLALEALVGLVSGIAMSIYGDRTNVYIAVGMFWIAAGWIAVLRTARARFDLGVFASLLVSATSRVLMYEDTKPRALTLLAVLFTCFLVYVRALYELKDGPL